MPGDIRSFLHSPYIFLERENMRIKKDPEIETLKIVATYDNDRDARLKARLLKREGRKAFVSPKNSKGKRSVYATD